MDSFLSGIRIAENEQLHMPAGKLYQNLSSLCEANDDFEHALYYRRQSMVHFEECRGCEGFDALYLSALTLLLRLYVKLKMSEDAAETNRQIQALLSQHPELESALEVLVYQLKYANQINDTDEIKRLKPLALASFKACDNVVKYFDECISLAKFLLSDKDYSNLEMILDTLEEVIGKPLYAELHLQLIQLRISMYKELGQENKMAQATYLYYEVSCLQRTEVRHSLCSVLNMKISLNQAEVTNFFLSVEADTDELTGISNRRKLNDESDRLFDLAMKHSHTFGIEMLDIDYFKICNDTYGHHMGDLCLRKLATVLRNMNDENQFCARYGGDEFFIIYTNLEDDEIMKRCRYLQEQVLKIKEELGIELFSISQGIMNAVPRRNNKVWDFTSAADEALYCVKQHGKNGIRLIHHLSELQ